MKRLIFLFIGIVLFLLINTARLHAQITQSELNQVELMKQFKGTWKAEIGKDSIIIWECESFGDALEFTIKSEISGIKTIDGKSLIGYDKKNDRLIEAVILKNSPIITLCPSWFNTTNSFEQIMWEDISNPEKAKWKW